jgi:Kdo2-lipid IVA lauroyltransferase/acyltransferase
MLLFILRRLAVLPLPLLQVLSRVLGLVVFLGSSNNRRTIAANLAQAGVQQSVFKTTQAIAKGALDMLWVWFNPSSVVCARITIAPHHETLVREALSGSQATLLLTPHLGCFEALAKWIAHQTPLTAMYRRPSRAWVASFIESARNTPNLTMARADASGVRLALKTLKSGGLLGILPDQVPKQGEGMWLPWFEREAYTVTLPAKLWLSTQARVYIICAIPVDTGWQIHCERVTLPQTDTVATVATHLNAALESTVRHNPTHYAWSYTRYKEVTGTR